MKTWRDTRSFRTPNSSASGPKSTTSGRIPGPLMDHDEDEGKDEDVDEDEGEIEGDSSENQDEEHGVGED